MEPLRILQVVPAMNCGGMETFIMNLYRGMNRRRVQFDFLYHYDVPSFYDEEIERLGGRIYKLTIRQDYCLWKYCRDLDCFFTQHPYTIIHGHYSGFGMFYNHYAAKHGVLWRIGHSHSTAAEHGIIGMLDQCMSLAFKYNLTHRFACGQAAGKHLFGKYVFSIVNNGIQCARFAFNAETAQRARTALHLGSRTVIGHIGRFDTVKNHAFLLDIFAAYHAQNTESALLLVGDGPLRSEAEKKAKDMHLLKDVIFTGLRTDTSEMYQAMDVFVMPSLFEGVSVACIEAQAAGLPCILADTIARETKLTPDVQFLSLSMPPKEWAKRIADASALPRAALNAQVIAKEGYSIETVSARLEQFYLMQATSDTAVSLPALQGGIH